MKIELAAQIVKWLFILAAIFSVVATALNYLYVEPRKAEHQKKVQDVFFKGIESNYTNIRNENLKIQSFFVKTSIEFKIEFNNNYDLSADNIYANAHSDNTNYELECDQKTLRFTQTKPPLYRPMGGNIFSYESEQEASDGYPLGQLINQIQGCTSHVLRIHFKNPQHIVDKKIHIRSFNIQYTINKKHSESFSYNANRDWPILPIKHEAYTVIQLNDVDSKAIKALRKIANKIENDIVANETKQSRD